MIDKKYLFLRIFNWCFLAYMAILPLANTIALRNILLFFLVCCLAYSVVFDHLLSINREFLKKIPIPLIGWFLFLILFPLWAEQQDVAWTNLKGQWSQSIFAWWIGISAVFILGRQGPSLLNLAVASTLPVFIHLLLVLLAWSGVLGSSIPSSLSASEIWLALTHVFDPTFHVNVAVGNFPWGFRGYDPMHGNLGYAACQAILLFWVFADFSWQKNQQIRFAVAIVGITMCFLSILIASSRGAVFFGLLMSVVAISVIFFRNKKIEGKYKHLISDRYHFKMLLGVFFALGLTGLVATKIMANDFRWGGVVDKISVGFDVEDPLAFLCDGLSSNDQKKIKDKYEIRGPAYSDDLITSLNSDGGRVILMRVGASLVFDNLRGIDGSRSTYERLIEKDCGHPPAIHFAHTHQGWMDITLALGIVGCFVFAWIFLYFVREGWRGTMSYSLNPWAFALFLISLFWMLRGLMDSVYREHYLQMQALLISYLFFRYLKSENKKINC